MFDQLTLRTVMSGKKSFASGFRAFVSKSLVAVDAVNSRADRVQRFTPLLILSGIHCEIHISPSVLQRRGKAIANAIGRRWGGRE